MAGDNHETGVAAASRRREKITPAGRGKSLRMTGEKMAKLPAARSRLAPALALLGTVFLALAVVIWFNDALVVKPFGIKLELMEPNAWWYGAVLWIAALLLWPAPPWPAERVLAVVVRLGRAVGLALERPADRYAALGVFLGAAAGCFFALQYYYLAPALGLRLLIVAVAAGAGGIVHRGFASTFERAGARLFPAAPWRTASARLSAYLVFWSLLITFPLRQWEARGTEPMIGESLLAAAAGLVLVWLFLARWRAPGLAGLARRLGLGLALVAALVAGVIAWRAEEGRLHPAEPPRARVLLITVDTTRADYLSCYGYPRQTSPNLDRLAASGARFARAFCQMGSTDPSHASILTGAYPRTHGLQNNYQAVTGNVPSLASVFYDRGFTTAAIVSREHVLPTNLNIPGFSEMSGVQAWLASVSAHETYRRVANFLLAHRDQDLFLWVHFFDPHGPYEPHPGISDGFIEKNKGKRGGRRLLKPGQHYSEKDIKYRRDLYAGEIFYLDYYLGKLFDLVNNLEPKAQTPPLILVIADHGEFLGEYQDHPARIGFGHGPVFNPGVHVPLIVSWPGIVPAGRTIDDIAESVDVAPTLLDYALDFRAYPGQGASLRPAIEGKGHTDQLALVHGEGGAYSKISPLYAVIYNSFKLMISVDADGELFDLDRDWNEKTDLRPLRPDMVEELTWQYRRWEAQTPETRVIERELTPAEKKTLRALGYID
jgi:arylsulfatase A-like enzyme